MTKTSCLLFALLVACFQLTHGYVPQKLSNCKVKLDDGRIIDLSSLDKPNSPKQTTLSDYTYTYNPCTSIQCYTQPTTPIQTAICQRSLNGKYSFDLGSESSISFDYSNSILSMMFVAGDGQRRSTIGCICDRSTESFTITSDDGKPFIFVLKSKCCCPDGCSGGGGGGGETSDGLSFGSILLIIFFTVLIAYFVAGIAFFKFVKHRSGKEMIPHVEFWSGLPGQVKDGFGFVKSKISANRSYSQI